MANYRFKKNEESHRGVEVTKRTLKINPLALVICLLIAIVFWLSVVNKENADVQKDAATASAEYVASGGACEL